MLTVIDNGVKIQLTAEPNPNQWLTLILITAIFLSAVGVGVALGWLSVRWSIASLALIAVMSYFWQIYKQKYDFPIITGGEIIVHNKQIVHLSATGTSEQIAIAPNNSLELFDNGLNILNENGKIRYQILGFQQPQHATIAQAVLQGKTIQMQGKTIKMQSN